MSRARKLLPVLAAVLVVSPLAMAGAGGGGACHSAATTEARGAGVALSDSCFEPTALRIGPGDTVTWTNKDHVAHTITAAGGTFDGKVDVGDTFAYRFTSAGVYPYYCLVHPGMAGAILVGGDRTTSVAALQPQPANDAGDGSDNDPMKAAAITAFVATPLAFAAGRILRTRASSA